MDCLDRTNVVQSYLARRILTIQLRESGILGPQQEIEEFKNFINMFNNGKSIYMLYIYIYIYIYIYFFFFFFFFNIF